MAISRHDPEWKRVIFMALAAGAVFTHSPKRQKEAWKLEHTWHVHWNGTSATEISKYRCALIVLKHMGVDASNLPDAATPQTAPSGPDGN